ncbi:MAG: DUF916 and DUF3324 domain-containing protein [Lachnospiraceae bacterium]|nr:DUF916 and DUF3324 domain-containing protein [Lachnospiraceae bacterium]
MNNNDKDNKNIKDEELINSIHNSLDKINSLLMEREAEKSQYSSNSDVNMQQSTSANSGERMVQSTIAQPEEKITQSEPVKENERVTRNSVSSSNNKDENKEKKKSKLRVAIIALLLFIVALLCAGLFYFNFYLNKKNKAVAVVTKKDISSKEKLDEKVEPITIKPKLEDTDLGIRKDLDTQVGFTFTIPTTTSQESKHRDYSYPWLMVESGHSYTQDIIVVNGSKASTFTLIASNEITNTNLLNTVYSEGSSNQDYVDYDRPINFEESVSFDSSGNYIRFKVPANKTAKIQMKIMVPAKAFDGVSVGGLYLSRDVRPDEVAKSGYTSKYSYHKALVIQEKTETPVGKLEFDKTWLQVDSNQEAAFAQLTNPTGRILHDVTAKIIVKNESKKVVAERKIENGVVVSYDKFNVKVPLKKKLLPGNYSLDIRVSASEGLWQFMEDFSVTRQAIKTLEQDKKVDKVYLFMKKLPYIIIGILTLIIIYLLYREIKHRSRNNGLEETA